jgi:hypothetical protein
MSHMQFIYEDFVRPTDWKALVVANKILLVTERDWGSWVKIEQLLHVEDLDTVSLRLAANDRARCSERSMLVAVQGMRACLRQ